MSLALSVPVLGLERICPRKGCLWPRILFVSLASSLVSSTSPLLLSIVTRGGVEDTRLEAKDTKKSEAKAKDSPSEDRPSRGQGPKTQAQVLSKKKVFRKFFQAISRKNRFAKNFLGASQIFNNSKNSAVLEPRTWGFKAKDLTFEAKDIKMYSRGLHL